MGGVQRVVLLPSASGGGAGGVAFPVDVAAFSAHRVTVLPALPSGL